MMPLDMVLSTTVEGAGRHAKLSQPPQEIQPLVFGKALSEMDTQVFKTAAASLRGASVSDDAD